MTSANDIQRELRSLGSYDNLLHLLESLGFSYSGEPRSTADWPKVLQATVSDYRLAAQHGQFGVFYLVIPGTEMLGWERQITSRILKTEPHSIFVFTESEHRLWHFVHIRYDEQAERRRQLRRFVVDLRETRAATRLRTTAERLARIAIEPGESLSVLDIQKRCDEAFRVSEVTDRFLNSFVGVVKDLTLVLRRANPILLSSDHEALRQAQLLMDRLVFLYFVQKKNWLNGEQDYLYQRFRKSYEANQQDDTYYRERLLPLFRALSHRDAPRPRLDDGTNEALPFLNGGLFELPLSYGTAKPPTDELIKVPNEALYPVFENFLENYNFTTTEDTPLDVEVAINPEVIGTIFETFVLTSEKESDTNAPDRRKATGSFYTPRCVVHFISRAVIRRFLVEQTNIEEAKIKLLIEFVPADQLMPEDEDALKALLSPEKARQISEALRKMRACDPAVGSGAFLVGLLQEIVKLAIILDVRIHGRQHVRGRNYAYHLKKRVIEGSLYGVDVQEEAVQICELRLWLSLVVDQQVDEKLDLYQRISAVEPLPNLTFRVRVGDSLLDQIFGQDWEVRNQRHDDLIQEITTIKRTYYGSESPEGKRELEMKIVRLQLQLLERLLEEERQTTGTSIPMLAGLVTAKQKRELDTVKDRLAEIDRMLKYCREAQHMAAQSAQYTWEDTRRFDALRKQLKVSFVWNLDFAEVFDPNGQDGSRRQPGFDVIVGNPPFVTARNPAMRERYRQRWPVSCYKKYHLLAPFTELALTKLLRESGQLGYIVSNAFATRDFGKPLVEQVFERAELRNVVDCSGLMFPGHGTPTCLLLGHAVKGKPQVGTCFCGTKPGMGQLHDEAEETELWQEIEAGWETESFTGKRVQVIDWETATARKHPWSLNAGGFALKAVIEQAGLALREYLIDDIGVATMTNSDEVFNQSPDIFRRLVQYPDDLRYFIEGDDLRDWSVHHVQAVLAPYDENQHTIPWGKLSKLTQHYLSRFKKHLGERISFGSRTFDQLERSWWSFERWNSTKYAAPVIIPTAFMATHAHCVTSKQAVAFKQSCQLITLGLNLSPHLLAIAYASSSALFWLRQVCFCKRESANTETDNYYEFAGGKVQQLPVPRLLLENTAVRERAGRLATACSKLGELIPGLHPRKLFEKPGEAYTDWYRGIRGYQVPHSGLVLDWHTPDDLKTAWQLAVDEMHHLRAKMVALQEEMDWLMYGAYGLLSLEHPAVNLNGSLDPIPVDRSQRPYRLAQNEQAVPVEWPVEQKALWQARLDATAGNDFISQLEQPSYKRRWEEPFDDKDFLHAYEWWLREKAEYLLETSYDGGPISLEVWAAELWKDARIQAAYTVAVEIGVALGDVDYQRDRNNASFSRHLKRIIDVETVPDKRSEFNQKHIKLRGINPDKHLPNGVPRERFRSVTASPGFYVWAGKDIWNGVQGDVWDA